MEWFNRPDFGEEPKLCSIVFSTCLVDLNLEYSSRSGFGTLISLVFFSYMLLYLGMFLGPK
jgi:hypothetical protein